MQKRRRVSVTFEALDPKSACDRKTHKYRTHKMSSMKRFYSTSVCVLAFATLITFAGASQQKRATKAPIVRIHPVTRAEYDALVQLAKDPTQISEGRLIITSGLTAIRDLALGLTSGIFPNFFTNLVNRNNDVASDKISNDISDKDESEEESPLCVIATEESTIDDPTERAQAGDDEDDTPIVNCVVVVKNREGEDPQRNVHRILRQQQQQQNSGMPWYPYPPNPYTNSIPYMPWFNDAAATQPSPYYLPAPYYPPYPQVYSEALPNVRTFTAPKKKYSSKTKAKRTRFTRALKMMPPSQLSHKFATEGSEQQPQADIQEAEEDEEQQQQNSSVEFNDVMNEQEASVHTNELPNVGYAYEPVLYPQFGYQSNYPKVAYAHALPYPAPVYIAPTINTPTPPTTTKTLTISPTTKPTK